MNTGTLYIISAPSGAGKTSLVKALCQALPDMRVSVSHTTRPIRPGENNGVNYNFVSADEFANFIARDEFLEYAKVFDHYYGTSKTGVLEQLSQGKNVILEIDWQGAEQIRQKFPEVVTIFILPPSYDVLRERLQARGQDNEAIIEKRMLKARHEISHFHEFGYIVVNDNFDKALEDLVIICRSQQLTLAKQQENLRFLLANLLG